MQKVLRTFMVFAVVAVTAFAPVAVNAEPSADEAKYKAQWDAAFQHIDDTFLIGAVGGFAFSLVPSSDTVRKYLTKNIAPVQLVLRKFGIDPAKYQYSSLDGPQVARITSGIRLAKSYTNARRKAEILAYAVCPWESDACKAEVKAAIYTHRGWTV